MEEYDGYGGYENEEIETSKNEVKQMRNDSSMHDLLNKKDLTSDQKITIAKSNEIKRKKMEIATFRNDYSILKAEIIVMDKNLGRNVVPRKRAVDQLNIIMKSDDFKERYENGFVAKRHWNVMMDFFRIDQDIVPELVILNEFLIEGIKQVANIVDISSTIDSSDRLLTQIEQILKNNDTIFTKILDNASDLSTKTIQHHEDKVEKDMNSLRKINEIANLQNKRKYELLQEEMVKLKNIINGLENVRYKNDSGFSENISQPQSQSQILPQPQSQVLSQSQVFSGKEIQNNFFPPNKVEEELFENIINNEQPLPNNLDKKSSVSDEDKSNLVPEDNEKIFEKVDQNVSNVQNPNFPNNDQLKSGEIPIEKSEIPIEKSEIPIEKSEIPKENNQVVNDEGEITSVSRLEDMKIFTDEFFEKHHSFYNFKKEFREEFSPGLTENELIDRYKTNIKIKSRINDV